MPTAHLQVVGRVQGVGFRWFTRVAARRLNLAGWVMNRADGSVEIAASGPQEKLDELRKILARGPDGAEVAEIVDLEGVDPQSLEFPFTINKSGAKRILR